MIEDNKDIVIEIFSGTLWEAEMIVSLLSEAGIASFIKNDILNTYAYEPLFSSGVKVMILNADAAQAKEVVDTYMRNLKGSATD